MNYLYLLIPIALIFLILAIKFLMWAIKSGQYDDLDTEGKRILFDEELESVEQSKPVTSETEKLKQDE